MPAGTSAEDAMISAMESAHIGVVVLSPEFVARIWPMKEPMADVLPATSLGRQARFDDSTGDCSVFLAAQNR